VRKTIGLDALPRKGYKVAELNNDAVREMGLYSYYILYKIKSDNLIEVLAVINKRRHLEADDIPRNQ
jgi:plasmid stabilization system protein ParE